MRPHKTFILSSRSLRNIFQNVLRPRMPDKFRSIQDIDFVGVLAAPLAGPEQRQIDLFSERADPPDLPGRCAHHHRQWEKIDTEFPSLHALPTIALRST